MQTLKDKPARETAMDPNVIKANLFLKVLLPHLETLMELDPQLKRMVRGWNNVIQFEVLNGGPAAHLEFQGGNLKVKQGAHSSPTVLFTFDSVKDIVDMMDGVTKPMPKKGLLHLIILLKFMKLTAAMEKTLKPSAADLEDPVRLKRTVTLLLNTAVFGMREIAEYDPGVEPTVHHLADGCAQFAVLPDGPFAYMEVKDQTLFPSKGKTASPSVELEVKDLKIAYGMLSGELDTMAAIGRGDIVLRGFIPLFGDLSYIMGRISQYLG